MFSLELLSRGYEQNSHQGHLNIPPSNSNLVPHGSIGLHWIA